jgi:hypothetical protein
MVEKVKAWCADEMKTVLEHGGDIQAAITRCYGIVMFVSNSVLGYDTPEAKELVSWWDDEMLMRFREVQAYQYEMRHAPSYINTSGVGAT